MTILIANNMQLDMDSAAQQVFAVEPFLTTELLLYGTELAVFDKTTGDSGSFIVTDTYVRGNTLRFK